MGDVIQFNGLPNHDEVDPDQVLDNARALGLDTVLVVGWRGDTQFFYLPSTNDIADLLLMLRLAERDILESMN